MDKPYFIVNPVSGSGLAAQKFKEVSKLLEAKGVDFSFDYTAAPRHATELARAAVAPVSYTHLTLPTIA